VSNQWAGYDPSLISQQVVPPQVVPQTTSVVVTGASVQLAPVLPLAPPVRFLPPYEPDHALRARMRAAIGWSEDVPLCEECFNPRYACRCSPALLPARGEVR
jgi:hypothetical protein